MAPQEPTLTRSPKAQFQTKTLEQERMQDVLLILSNLFEREEATVKLVLACLYEVGAANLISKKIRSRLLKNVMSPTAKISKPLFMFVGIRWFQSQVPKLLADWLQSQVAFDPGEPELAEIDADSRSVNAGELPGAADVRAAMVEEIRLREIQKLRGRVRLLAASLIALVALLGSAVFWLDRELRQERLESASREQQQVVPSLTEANSP